MVYGAKSVSGAVKTVFCCFEPKLSESVCKEFAKLFKATASYMQALRTLNIKATNPVLSQSCPRDGFVFLKIHNKLLNICARYGIILGNKLKFTGEHNNEST